LLFSLSKSHLSFHDIFEEVPIHLRSSSLANAALYELEDSQLWDPKASVFDSLDLSTNPFLEKNLEFLIEYLDDLSVEQNRFQYYQRNLQRQQAQLALWLQRRRAENMQRRANGEEELPEEEDPLTNNLFKPLSEPSRLESLLITNQINNYCEQVNQFTGQSFGKLFLLNTLKK
jgi:translation initiation factor 3 subunit H